MALDDLDGCTEPLFALLELAWRVAGPYTLALGVLAFGWSSVEAMGEGRWWLAAFVSTGLGLLSGWAVDLSTRFLLLPLVRLARPDARGKRAHLAVGAPLALVAAWFLVTLG